MIEVHLTYEVLPDIDEQLYFEWMKKAVVPALKSHGFVDVRGYRNATESQKALVVGTWQTLEDWTTFSQSEGWHLFIDPLKSKFSANQHIEIWGPSPLIPGAIRAHK